MTITEILELFNLVRDPITRRLTQFGEAAQMQAHPSGGINRVYIVERIALAKYLAGSTVLDVRADLPAGNQDNPALSAAIAGEGPGNRDAWGTVLPEGSYGTAATRLSPANRALALCIVAIHDEVADIQAKAESSRREDNTLLQSKVAEGAIRIDEINSWVADRTVEVIAQARRDIEALGNGVGLATLGEGLAQEAISADTIHTLLSKRAYDNARSRLSAQQHFDAQRFEQRDVIARRQAILEAQTEAGVLNSLIRPLSINASRVYRDLLSRELAKLEAAIKAGQARFTAQNFSRIGDLMARRKAVIEAETATELELSLDALQVYHSLLFQERAMLDAWIALGRAYFIAQGFDEEPNLARQFASLTTALTPAALAETGLTSEPLQFYQSLLTQAYTTATKAIAEALNNQNTPSALLAEIAQVTKLESELLTIVAHPNTDETVLSAVASNPKGACTDRVDKEIIKHGRAGAVALTAIAQRTEDPMDLVKISGHPHRTLDIEAITLARRRTPLMLSRAAIQIVQSSNRMQAAVTLLAGLSQQECATVVDDSARKRGWW